jgi:SAM-dependent methyltransferase
MSAAATGYCCACSLAAAAKWWASTSPPISPSARATCGDLSNVTVLSGELLSIDGLAGATFDLVTAYASIHHMPLEPALRRMAVLLRPGGRLLVVGLARDRLAPARAVALLAELDQAAGLGRYFLP